MGVVECDSQEPIARALVYLVGESFMAKTDNEGQFRLHAVPPGRYELEIETPDGNVSTIDITIPKEKNRIKNLGVLRIKCSSSSNSTPPASSIPCQNSNDCTEGTYCQKDGPECGASGICVPDTLNCTDAYSPVCGCDWETYTNECLATKSGVNLRFDGWCNVY
jgi:hypothetical protein